MRRFITGALALALVLDATATWAAAEKKSRKRGKKAHKHAAHKAGEATGPFQDVPKGHWAYDAIQKSAESGVLQGWDNKFHGNKVVNRYQMAVVVARMLDRVGVLKANGKVITAQDIANLESLTIEFADELALLNVKVSTLEDTVAGLKKDVDLIKADLRGVGARAGITGTMQARYVFTDDVNNTWHPTRFFGLANGVTGGAAAPVPGVAATGAMTRYRGVQTSGMVPNTVVPAAGNVATGAPAVTGANQANPFQYDSRNFFSVSNFAINVDREFDAGVHFHSQIDINAEGEQSAGVNAAALGIGTLPGSARAVDTGRGESFAFAGQDISINEAYVVWDNWFTDGVNGRLGIWAVPMNFELNGPSRTYQWTITPSVANAKWESLRPVGLDIFQHNDKDSLVFYAGFFTPGDTAGGVNRSGTLMSAPTGYTLYVPGSTVAGGTAVANIAAAGAMTDTLANPANASLTAAQVAAGATFGEGRFPTPISAAITDAPRGVNGQTLAFDDIGFYAMVGTKPTSKSGEGLTWNVAYYDRNGDINAAQSDNLSATDWNAWQLSGKYQWEHVVLAMQYFDGTSKNHSTASFINAVDQRRANTTPFANAAGTDTDSESFMALVNWQFNKRGSVTGRYENAEDRTGVARVEADIWTFGFNWKTTDHSWFQFEWILPTTRSTSENGVVNSLDVDDDMVSLNYKLNW